MKKALPMPLILGAVAVVALAAVFFVFRGAAGPSEFAPPPVSKNIPRYIFDKLPASEQKRMEGEGYKTTDGASSSVPPAGAAPTGR